MIAKVAFPPKSVEEHSYLYGHHSTGPARSSWDPQWVLLLCDKGGWVFVILVRCLFKNFSRISSARASITSPGWFQCYTTFNIRKILLVFNIILHANSNELLFPQSTTGMANYFISPFSSLSYTWIMLQGSLACFNLNDPPSFLYRSWFPDFFIVLLRILFSWSTIFLKDNAWN